MENDNFMFVLWWQYHDQSGQEIVRVYNNEKRAKEDLEIVCRDDSKIWRIEKVPLFIA